MDFYLYTALIFSIIFFLGKFLERIKIPWIFSALLLGIIVNYLAQVYSVPVPDGYLKLFGNIGMYFLLFLIGFEIDVAKIRKHLKHILKITSFIILAETVVSSLILYFWFGVNWIVAIIVSLSFATVGEGALLPILDDLGLTKKKIGQLALSVAVVDDIFEVLALVLFSGFMFMQNFSGGVSAQNRLLNLGIFIGVSAFFWFILPRVSRKYLFSSNTSFSAMFLFSLAVFFLFIGLGEKLELDALSALMAGIILKYSLPSKEVNLYENELRTLAYGLFGPFFFFAVGLETDATVLSSDFLVILVFALIIKLTKITATFLASHSELGLKNSLTLGILLCVKLSTSIVLVKYFFDKGYITSYLFSILIGMKIFFKFFIPIIVDKIQKSRLV